MFYCFTCCCYRFHKWVLYIFTSIFGLFGLAFLGYTIWLNQRFKLVIPPNILQFCFATTSFLVITSLIGFYGTRKADDVHEERGRNYFLFIYFLCVLVGSVVIAVQVDFAKQSLDTVNGCDEPYAVEPDDCPLELTEWIEANSAEWKDLQTRWDCCGLDPRDQFATNPIWNATCPPPQTNPVGCRHSFLTTVFTACVAIIAMSALMLMSQAASAVAACCLFSCKFADRTVEGWSIDGHAFQVLGQQTPAPNAALRRNINPNSALLPDGPNS